MKKEAEDKKKASLGGGGDWWVDTSYKGKVYLPLSSDPQKVVTKSGDKDQLPQLSLPSPSPLPVKFGRQTYYQTYYDDHY